MNRTGDGCLKNPFGIMVHRTEVYVSDFDNNCIQVFDTSGNWKRSFGEGRLSGPVAICQYSGWIYAAEYKGDRISVWNHFGELIRNWGSRGQVFSP